MLFLFFMLFGSGAWFFSDGLIFWPKESTRYEKYAEVRDRLIESGAAKDEESSAVRLEWEKLARKEGLKTKVPKERTADAIREQLIYGSVFIGASLLFALWVAWNHRLRVRGEGNVITGTKGEKVPLESIERLDRRKWDNKGIMYAFYTDDGSERRLTLDAHKFDGVATIIEAVEAHLRGPLEGGAADAAGSSASAVDAVADGDD